MSRPRMSVPRALATLAAAVLLTGCAAGFDATTTKDYAPADGVMGKSGPIKVLNALVVAPDDGSTGVVIMTVVNRGDEDERLVSLDTGAGTIDYTGPRLLPAGQAVTFGAESNPSALVENLTAKPGETIALRFTFENTEPLTVRTVVVPATNEYATITPAPEPTPTTPTSTSTESPTESPTESATQE